MYKNPKERRAEGDVFLIDVLIVATEEGAVKGNSIGKVASKMIIDT